MDESYNDLASAGAAVSSMALWPRPSSSDGFGARMSVNGAGATNNTFLIDGTVINDNSQTAGTVNADSLGVEGIREFTVLTHNYAAEFGHNAGGIVNAVTRSGTNQLHGSLYEFLRNNDLDARDFFQTGSIAPFHRNQFGGSIGGRVKKDKLFFFGNYEGFRQILSIPIAGNVPDQNAHNGTIPLSAAGMCNRSQGSFNAATGLCHIGVSPHSHNHTWPCIRYRTGCTTVARARAFWTYQLLTADHRELLHGEGGLSRVRER